MGGQGRKSRGARRRAGAKALRQGNGGLAPRAAQPPPGVAMWKRLRTGVGAAWGGLCPAEEGAWSHRQLKLFSKVTSSDACFRNINLLAL